jgi:RNA polymerase sigma-70 factor (ECF subfamily)
VDRPAAAPYVPLDEQDPGEWDAALLAAGEAYLRRAAALGRPGRFQLEAALRSAHTARATTGAVDHDAVRRLSAALVRVSPTLGARVAHAVAVARLDGPEAGLALLDAVDAPPTFQPAAAARAALLAEAGLDATDAYASAIALTDDPGVRAWLERQAKR